MSMHNDNDKTKQQQKTHNSIQFNKRNY